MTIDEAKRCYLAGLRSIDPTDADFTTDEWESIRREMERVVSAPSDRDGGHIINWWDCWQSGYTPTSFARRVRAAHRKGMM